MICEAATGAEVTLKTLSSREFGEDTASAKLAAQDGPVVITDQGTPTHVLLTYKEYERLAKGNHTAVELLGAPGHEDVPFDPLRADIGTTPAELD